MIRRWLRWIPQSVAGDPNRLCLRGERVPIERETGEVRETVEEGEGDWMARVDEVEIGEVGTVSGCYLDEEVVGGGVLMRGLEQSGCSLQIQSPSSRA